MFLAFRLGSQMKESSMTCSSMCWLGEVVCTSAVRWENCVRRNLDVEDMSGSHRNRAIVSRHTRMSLPHSCMNLYELSCPQHYINALASPLCAVSWTSAHLEH